VASKSVVDEHSEELRDVTLPSGAPFKVYPREVSYVRDRVRRYLKDNVFTNVSDLQDVDRLISLELLVWRYTLWVSQQKDYWGEPIDEPGYARMVKEISGELRQLKATLGLDKLTRDKQRGDDSVAAYLQDLAVRAREFGIMRNEQAAKAIELFKTLQYKLNLHDNCTERERLENEITSDHILEWLRSSAIPEFEAIDAAFRENVQKMWIRKM